MNKLLEQQIIKYLNGIDINNPSIQQFLQIISDTYDTTEADKGIINDSLQIFKTAVDDAADLITFFDENMKFIYANKAAMSNGGFGDIIGKSISEAGSSITNQDDLNRYIEFVKGGHDKFVSEMIVPDAFGSQAIFQTYTTIARAAKDQKIGINISRDITKERALKLEKDEFISIASHELRTPMTAIRGFISLLEREQMGPVNPEQKEILCKVSRNTKTLIDLVNDMLDLSRLEANRLDLNISNIPIDNIFDSAIEKIHILYETKNIELVCLGDQTIVKTDPDKLERVILNLLGNSYKFTPSGGKVTITNSINAERHMVIVCISDTGLGIPPSSLNSLFKKFSQVDSVLHRQTGGTGLGLSICKGIIEALGGTIWVKSTPGSGSQFYFTVPMGETIIDNMKPLEQ